jgi:ribosomal protein L28
MAKQCTICKKGTMMVGKYSNRVRAEKFNPTGKKRKFPNLQWATFPNGKRKKICTSCIKKGVNLKLN